MLLTLPAIFHHEMSFEKNFEDLKKDLHIQKLFSPLPLCASYFDRIDFHYVSLFFKKIDK